MADGWISSPSLPRLRTAAQRRRELSGRWRGAIQVAGPPEPAFPAAAASRIGGDGAAARRPPAGEATWARAATIWGDGDLGGGDGDFPAAGAQAWWAVASGKENERVVGRFAGFASRSVVFYIFGRQ